MRENPRRRASEDLPPNSPTLGWVYRIVTALHDHGGSTDRPDRRFVHSRLRAQRAQPAGRKPGLGNHELRPATIQTNSDIGGWGHRGVTQSAGTVAIEPDLRGYERKGVGLALGADHIHTSGSSKLAELPKSLRGSDSI